MHQLYFSTKKWLHQHLVSAPPGLMLSILFWSLSISCCCSLPPDNLKVEIEPSVELLKGALSLLQKPKNFSLAQAPCNKNHFLHFFCLGAPLLECHCHSQYLSCGSLRSSVGTSCSHVGRIFRLSNKAWCTSSTAAPQNEHCSSSIAILCFSCCFVGTRPFCTSSRRKL